MFGVYMFMMNGWNSAVKTLARFTEEKNENEETKQELKSVPLQNIESEEEEDEDEDEEGVPLSQELVPWEEDRESVGSSVVDFHSPSELDNYPTEDLPSHPVTT